MRTPRMQQSFALALPRERTHVDADTGIGVLMKIVMPVDIGGEPRDGHTGGSQVP